MKAHELANLLLNGPDQEVVLTFDYGDHCRTTAARIVKSVKPTLVAPWPYGGEGCLKVVEDENGETFESIEEWQNQWDHDLIDADPEGDHGLDSIALFMSV